MRAVLVGVAVLNAGWVRYNEPQRQQLARTILNDTMTSEFNLIDSPTLDPPGTIVVLGTTPVGIEAALYGRYLGYSVTLIAGVDAWISPQLDPTVATRRLGPTFNNDWLSRHWLGDQSIASRWDDAMPMLPDQCLSPLAIEAITAQQEGAAFVLPISMRQWVEEGLQAILETDLLRGRCFPDTFVQSIGLVEVGDEDDADPNDGTNDDDENNDSDIPPDFLLTLSGAAIRDSDTQQIQCECIIVADVPIASIELGFELPADYFYQITSAGERRAADEVRAGWRQIATIYAELAGRSGLDLYRPRRL